MSAAQHAQTPGLARGATIPGRWTVVPDASRAEFHVRDKLATTVRGTMPVQDGEIVVSGPGDVTRAWVNLTVAGIATGNARRDRDLLGARFLDAARCPVVTVSVDAVTPTSDGWTATGTLLARGSNAAVDLTAAVVDRSPSEVQIRVTATLDRRPLAIKVPSFVIGRFVGLEADLTFRLVQDVEAFRGPAGLR